MSIFSFHPVKTVAMGEGGAITTNDIKLASRLRILRNIGMTHDPASFQSKDQAFDSHGNANPWYYEMHELGYNYRLTDFQCALGSSQLKKLDDFVGKRTKCAKRYDKFFSNSDYFKTPLTKKSITHSYHLYPLQIEFERLALSKAEFFIRMKESGINLQVHYIPIHLQPFYRKNYKFKIGDLPISEEFYTKAISLPVFPSLKKNNMSKVKKEIFNLLP